MIKVETTTQLSIDDVVYAVDECSAEVQQLVGFMDDWRQREIDTQSELVLVRAAIRDVQNNIVNLIKAANLAKESVAITEASAEAPDASESAAE